MKPQIRLVADRDVQSPQPAAKLARVPKSARKSPDGEATNDLVFSSHLGTYDDLFPQILNLYVAPGCAVADVTYGAGVFWRNVPSSQYHLLATDLKDGVDCRRLPYGDGSVECVVFDPPYMHTPGGTAHHNHQNFEQYYRNNSTSSSSHKYHDAVLALYFEAATEAFRVLAPGGVVIPPENEGL
jgi:hypothetical protein